MSPPIVREVIEKGDVAAVLLYDPQRDEVVMIEQFRIGARDDPRGPWLLEIVAGLIEPGETPAQVARREAMEEAGCTVLDLLPISTFYTSPAKTSQRTHLYLGRVDSSQRRRHSRPGRRGRGHPRRLPGRRTGGQAWPSRGRPTRPGR
jgi:ADP-ribose pyrophosphatase